MDSVKITITRGCDPDGNGGTIADDAAVLLPDTVLDTLCAAFASAYGVHTIPNADPEGDPVPVSMERNLTYRLRMYATEVLTAFASQQAAKQAAAAAAAQIAAIMSKVETKE